MSHRLIRLQPESLTLSGLPVHVARIPAAPFPRAIPSLTHDLPGSLVLSLPLKNRYPRGFSAYPAASQPAVFAPRGLSRPSRRFPICSILVPFTDCSASPDYSPVDVATIDSNLLLRPPRT